jgi:hypothetical protein
VTVLRNASRERWTVVSNTALTDKRLSLRARGLLVICLSKPDGWDFSCDRLAEECREGRDAVRAAMRELESAEYVLRARKQDGTGHWRTEVLVSELPGGWKTDAWKSVVGPTSTDIAYAQVTPTTENPAVGTSGIQVTTDDQVLEVLTIAPPKATRRADPLWDAVMLACNISTDITSQARGRYNKAVKELRDIDADPDEVPRRAQVYKVKWPNTSLTPTALARHWAELVPNGHNLPGAVVPKGFGALARVFGEAI